MCPRANAKMREPCSRGRSPNLPISFHNTSHPTRPPHHTSPPTHSRHTGDHAGRLIFAPPVSASCKNCSSLFFALMLFHGTEGAGTGVGGGRAARESGGGGAWGRAQGPRCRAGIFLGFFFPTRSARGARTKITSVLGQTHACE
jgi:hypothetical protein